MSQDNIDAFPLCWPIDFPRHKGQREWGKFKGTPDRIRRELLQEIDRLVLGNQARGYTREHTYIISTNVPLRQDGMPYASAREPEDPGVAVYFKYKDQDIAIACDKYDRVWKNMRAIQKTIEAMRGIERWGSSDLLDRAFTGFAQLPAPGEVTGANAWTVLGIAPTNNKSAIKSAFRAKAKTMHPDHGGTEDQWHDLQQAYNDALSQANESR